MSAARDHDSRLIAECDDTVLAQWREKNLDYAADVVEAYQRRLRLAEGQILVRHWPEYEEAIGMRKERLSKAAGFDA